MGKSELHQGPRRWMEWEDDGCSQALQSMTHTQTGRQTLLFIPGVTQERGNQPQPRQTPHDAFPNGQGSTGSCPWRLHRAQQGRRHLQRDRRGGSWSSAVPCHTVCAPLSCPLQGSQQHFAAGQVTPVTYPLPLSHCSNLMSYIGHRWKERLWEAAL